MAAARAFVAVVVALCLSHVVVGYEKEIKPNNYPNFEFHESPVQETAEVEPHNFESSEFSQSGDKVPVASRVQKVNNYPDFKFSETPGYGQARDGNAHDQFAQGHHTRFHAVPDTGDRFSSKEKTYDAKDGEVYNAHHQEFSGETYYSTDVPVYRGSDAQNRYPSSYELINSREHENQGDEFGSSFSSNDAPFSNHREEEANTPVHSGSSSVFWSPSSDPDFAFRFAKPDRPATFGDNSFKGQDNTDDNAFSQFSLENRDNANDISRATYGTTSRVNSLRKNTPAATAGHGCTNMYWAEHTNQWPSFFNINTQVAQAFGTKAGEVYGTTTLLQALYDNRADGYSQLLSHGTAALLNSYTMPNYALRHDAVIDQFLGALSSRTASGVQAQKFLNQNHAYGPDECLN